MTCIWKLTIILSSDTQTPSLWREPGLTGLTAAWSSLLGKNVQKQKKNYFFKTPVATMCNFSSAKPANIIAMFDTIIKLSPVKCYSFKQSQVFPFQFRRLHQGWSSLPMLLGAPRACLASVLPQTVLLTIFLIWSPLDQLASALVISTTWSLSTSATHARATATIG